MTFEFAKLSDGQCALCGAHALATGEHKIKASLIRAEFGDQPTVFLGLEGPRIAQSAKSKHFHFKAAVLCKECNSSRTQSGDRAFDQLHTELKRLRDHGLALTGPDHRPNVQLPADTERGAFRYFAKLICCFLAEVGGPQSKSISSFAIGRSDHNPIYLNVKLDDEYEANLAAHGTQGFARHGGLAFRFDAKKKWVNSIESSLSVGGIHYEFWVQPSFLAKLEFHVVCRDLVQVARHNIVDV